MPNTSDENFNIKQVFACESRSILSTFNNELYIGERDFNMFPLDSYKLFFSNGNGIKQVEIGSEHCMILDVRGGIYVVGDNTYGELGLNHVKNIESPTKLTFFNEYSDRIVKIQCGIRNSFVLLDNGELYAFGDNSEGQSTGYDTRYFNPTLVPFEFENKEKIIDIHSGYSHSFAIGSNGNVYSWGSSLDGKLGFSETSQFIQIPKIVQALKCKAVSHIYAGKDCTIVLAKNK